MALIPTVTSSDLITSSSQLVSEYKQARDFPRVFAKTASLTFGVENSVNYNKSLTRGINI